MYKLRDYQEEAVKSGIQAIKDKKNSLLVEPTGAGKSLIISAIAKEVGEILILQPSKEILEQNYKKMLDFGETDIAIYSASLKSKETAKITFATIGSIKDYSLFKNVKAIIVDEAHNVANKEGVYNKLFDALKVPVLGLTATPYRMAQSFVWENGVNTGEVVYVSKFLTRTRPRVFSQIAHITQIGYLFEKGYLQKPEYIIDRTYNSQKIKMNKSGSNFDQEAVEKYNKLQNLVKKAYNRVLESKSKTILIFVNSIKEAEELNLLLKKVNQNTVVITSKTKAKEREEYMSDFREGKIRVVINVGVLTTGFDFPELEEIIVARPTLSVALYYQIAGRVIRPHPEGRKKIFVDLAGNIKRFGKIEDFEIVEIKKGLHRLKSGDKYLTGVDIKSGVDLELKQIKTTELEKEDKLPTKIPFGKHKGVRFEKLPKNYLKWMAKDFTDGVFKKAAQRELRRRELSTRK